MFLNNCLWKTGHWSYETGQGLNETGHDQKLKFSKTGHQTRWS
jgi:hypothetical protein